MRILQLTSSYPLNQSDATAPFVRSIARALVNRGHEIHVLAPDRAGAPKQSREAGIVVDWIRYAPLARLRVIGHAQSLQNDMNLRTEVWPALPLFLGAQLLAGRSICRNWKPDIIQAHWVLPNGPVAALLAREYKLPLVINLHGSDAFMALKSSLYTRVARIAFNQAQAIVAPSFELKDNAIKIGADPKRIHILAHGVDMDLFSPGDMESNKLVVLFVGRLVAKKGLDVLLRSAPMVLDHLPSVEFWIAGYGDQLSVLESQVNSLPSQQRAKVCFLGPISWDAVPDLLRRASVFVAPSVRDMAGNQDGLPTVILEAMACGLPIVASEIAGIPLVVRHGQSGLLSPPDDPIALAENLIKVLSSAQMRIQMGRAGRQLIKDEFTWKSVAQNLESIFCGFVS